MTTEFQETGVIGAEGIPAALEQANEYEKSCLFFDPHGVSPAFMDDAYVVDCEKLMEELKSGALQMDEL